MKLKLKIPILKVLTKMQETCLRTSDSDISFYVDLYYLLTRLHFYIYYGKSLVTAAVQESKEFEAAAVRHSHMVITHTKDLKESTKKRLKPLLMISFHKNLILKYRLPRTKNI